MKYKVIIEEHLDTEFEIEAESQEAAEEIAIDKYNNGEIVVEPGDVTARLIAVADETGEIPYFNEF